MKFLMDQDVYRATTLFVGELGHDVVPVADMGLAQAADAELLREAELHGRIFVTRDRDFGALVFVENFRVGVIYLRLSPSTLQAVHREIARVLDLYSEKDLKKAFVVVEPGRHRFRKIK